MWHKSACEIHARYGHLTFGWCHKGRLTLLNRQTGKSLPTCCSILIVQRKKNHLMPTLMRLPSCRYWAMDLAMVSKKNQEYCRKG